MSTPKTFHSTEELLRACREHGLLTRYTGGGHWKIYQDRSGAGPNKVIATMASTSVHDRGFKNTVAIVKKAVGIDLRFRPDKPKLDKEKVFEPVPAQPHPLTVDTRRESLKADVRDLIREILLEWLNPPKAEVVPILREVEKPSVYESLPDDKESKPVKERKKRRSNLSVEEKDEIVKLLMEGETTAQVARAYNLSPTAISHVLRVRGMKMADMPGYLGPGWARRKRA